MLALMLGSFQGQASDAMTNSNDYTQETQPPTGEIDQNHGNPSAQSQSSSWFSNPMKWDWSGKSQEMTQWLRTQVSNAYYTGSDFYNFRSNINIMFDSMKNHFLQELEALSQILLKNTGEDVDREKKKKISGEVEKFIFRHGQKIKDSIKGFINQRVQYLATYPAAQWKEADLDKAIVALAKKKAQYAQDQKAEELQDNKISQEKQYSNYYQNYDQNEYQKYVVEPILENDDTRQF